MLKQKQVRRPRLDPDLALKAKAQLDAVLINYGFTVLQIPGKLAFHNSPKWRDGIYPLSRVGFRTAVRHIEYIVEHAAGEKQDAIWQVGKKYCDLTSEEVSEYYSISFRVEWPLDAKELIDTLSYPAPLKATDNQPITTTV